MKNDNLESKKGEEKHEKWPCDVKKMRGNALRWNEKMKEWGNEMRFAGMKKWENERVKMATSLELFVLHIIVNQEEKALRVKW